MLLQDLAPYLPSVTPGLKASLLDPVPEVRMGIAQYLENSFLEIPPQVTCVSLKRREEGWGSSCFFVVLTEPYLHPCLLWPM